MKGRRTTVSESSNAGGAADADSLSMSMFSTGGRDSELGTNQTRTSYADSEFHFQEAYPTGRQQQLYSSNVQTASTPGVLSPQQLTKKYTKLEVVTARQVEMLMRMQYVMIAVGGLYTLAMVVLVNTVYGKVYRTPKADGWEFDLKMYNLPWPLLWFNYVSRFVIFIATLLIAIVYTVRVGSRRSVKITHEQVWVILLLTSVTLYLLPLHEIVAIHDQLIGPSNSRSGMALQKSKLWINVLEPLVQIAFNFGFTSCTIFYVWASMHSYRFLSGTNIGVGFYLTKIIPLCLYVIIKLVVWYAFSNNKIYMAELPLANLTGMLALYYTANSWNKVGMWSAIVITIMDILFIGCILYERRRTKFELKKVDYLKNRSKQIGFRFFMYHNLTFYTLFISFYICLQLSVPNGAAVYFYHVRFPQISTFRTHDLNIGLNVMLFAYAWTEAYVNLPADALGFRGWFCAQVPRGFGADDTELEPITYRKREPPSMHGVLSEVNVNCFIMQTHVTMFNFAWLVYYWDTSKVDNFKITQDVFKFTIADYIKDQQTDTHVLIVDGADRLVVAFKGTTSLKNMKTDVRVFHTALRNLLPTTLPCADDYPPTTPQLCASKKWRRAQVHQGFATAYQAIAPRLLSVLRRLQENKRRPVFLTGHSLGGALATVCSLDLFLTLGMTRREIFVSTFGSPRVGNRQFQELFDESVPIHWRMVVGPDVVAKLPNVGYRHCGKKVFITVDGDLFMDPNSLELNLWSGDTASFQYHRKASYLLAMRAWCEKHHGDEYVPEFWPFPVSQDDEKRFEHLTTVDTLGPTGGNFDKKKQAKLLQFDAMIEKLADARVNDKVSVQKWAKLTNKLLQHVGDETV